MEIVKLKRLRDIDLERGKKYLLENITYLDEKIGMFEQIQFKIDNIVYQINSQKIFNENREKFEGNNIELYLIKAFYGKKESVEFSFENKIQKYEATKKTFLYLIELKKDIYIKLQKQITIQKQNKYENKLIDAGAKILETKEVEITNIINYIFKNYHIIGNEYVIEDENRYIWNFLTKVELPSKNSPLI